MVMDPVVLEGRFVRLEPLTLDHAPALWAVSDYPELYHYKPYVLRSQNDLRRFIDVAQQQHAAGAGLTFATLARDGGAIVGSSGFHSADWPHRRIEIGGTYGFFTVEDAEVEYLCALCGKKSGALRTWI